MSKDKLKDDLAKFHDYGIYVPTRTILLTGEIDQDTYESVAVNLHALNSTGSDDINIFIYSEGGDVVAGRGIYDAIRACDNCRVKGVVFGEASSAASFILQACDDRIMAPNSHLLLHIGEEGHATNHPRNIDNWHQFYRKLEAWLEDVYLKQIKKKKKRYTRNQMKSLLQWDKFIHPKEALELGLIDGILGE